MDVVGIDLAANPKTTGAVRLRPGAGPSWRAETVTGPLDDDALVDLVRGAGAVGLDAPLGWPDAFVAAVAAHHRHGRWSGGVDRSPLTHRETDRFTRPFVGRLPLSASADLLGVVAMRAALLQQRWADELWGAPAPRDGGGVLSETYPAAALAVWGIDSKGYKERRDPDRAARVREDVVAALAGATSAWLALDGVAVAAVDSDHVLDALVCALVAVAVGAGATHGPPAELAETARREGWIHVPSEPLAALRPR